MARKVLFVVAHPDDEMQCSGTVALQAAAGLDVTIAVACNGKLGGLPDLTTEERAARRHQEMQAACDVLGAKLEWLGHGDDDFMAHVTTRHSEAEMAFRNLIRRVNPDLLIVPSLNDYHQHHRAAAELALNASNNAGNPAIVSDEPASSGIPIALHMAPLPPGPFSPDLYVDITLVRTLRLLGAALVGGVSRACIAPPCRRFASRSDAGTRCRRVAARPHRPRPPAPDDDPAQRATRRRRLVLHPSVRLHHRPTASCCQRSTAASGWTRIWAAG